MDDNAKRWLFLLEGNLTVEHMVDEDQNLVGLLIASEYDVAECHSPQEVSEFVDRQMNLIHYSGSEH
jgi:hypothetical protein